MLSKLLLALIAIATTYAVLQSLPRGLSLTEWLVFGAIVIACEIVMTLIARWNNGR